MVVEAIKDLQTLTIDLTTARSDMEYTIPLHPLKSLLFWCDGTLRGVSIKVGDQSRPARGLDQVNVLPVFGQPERFYLTNDVRAGRSTLVIFFVDADLGLRLTNAGDPVDNAELAARLGSISTFDRRGHVIFADQFEQSLSSYTITLVGTGYAVISTESPYTGALSCKLYTTSTINDSVKLTRYDPLLQTSKCGFETIFEPPSGATITVYLAASDGTNITSLAVTLDMATGILAVAGRTLKTYTIPLIGTFHVMKLVVNPTTAKGARLIFDSDGFDISADAMTVAATLLAAMTVSEFTILTQSGTKSAYLAKWIVTENEP